MNGGVIDGQVRNRPAINSVFDTLSKIKAIQGDSTDREQIDRRFAVDVGSSIAIGGRAPVQRIRVGEVNVLQGDVAGRVKDRALLSIGNGAAGTCGVAATLNLETSWPISEVEIDSRRTTRS